MNVACLLGQETYKPGDQPPDGYLAWHEWAEVQRKAGIKQVQCGVCGMWRTPQELSEQMIRWTAKSRKGPVEQFHRYVTLKVWGWTPQAASPASGDYGYCEDTGDDIGLKRLLANPTAHLTVEAQQRREYRGKFHIGGAIHPPQ